MEKLGRPAAAPCPHRAIPRSTHTKINKVANPRIQAKPLRVSLTNPHPDPVIVDVTVAVPAGWASVPDQQVDLAAHGSAGLNVSVRPGQRTTVQQRNLVLIQAQPRAYPSTAPVPVPLVGASAWRVAEVVSGSDLSALPERSGPGKPWREIAVEGNAVPIADLLPGDGATTMLQTFVESPEPTEVRLAVDCSMSTRVFVNGTALMNSAGPRLIRPSYGVSDDVNKIVTLQSGFNEIVVLVNGGAVEAPELHLYLSTPDQLRDGIVHLRRTRFPWDHV